MEIKKAKFPPSTIDEVENTTLERLVSKVDRYIAPLEYCERIQSTWDQFASACAPPGDSTVQSYVQQ